MLERNDMADRLAAEALLAGIDGCDDLQLMPALCHRRHPDACRREILRRADLGVARRRPVPGA